MSKLDTLNLFGGMEVGRLAMRRADLSVGKYFSAEIDPYAIKIANKNHSDIIQLGDVTKINTKDLPQIDLLMGGSPCQGFSFAGK